MSSLKKIFFQNNLRKYRIFLVCYASISSVKDKKCIEEEINWSCFLILRKQLKLYRFIKWVQLILWNHLLVLVNGIWYISWKTKYPENKNIIKLIRIKKPESCVINRQPICIIKCDFFFQKNDLFICKCVKLLSSLMYFTNKL